MKEQMQSKQPEVQTVHKQSATSRSTSNVSVTRRVLTALCVTVALALSLTPAAAQAASNANKHRPQFSTILDRNVYVGEKLQFVIVAKDRDGDKIRVRGLKMPRGAKLQDRGNGTALFTWVPQANQEGRSYAKFVASELKLPKRRNVAGMRITVIQAKGDPTAGEVVARWLAGRARIDIRGKSAPRGKTVAVMDSAGRYIGRTVSNRFGAWRFAKSLPAEKVPCQIGIQVQGKKLVKVVTSAPSNCVKGDAQAQISDARWRADKSLFRVKGDLAPVGAVVEILNAETGAVVASTMARRTGRFSVRDTIGVPPCSIQLRINDVVSAPVDVRAASVACRMVADAGDMDDDGGANDDDGADDTVDTSDDDTGNDDTGNDDAGNDDNGNDDAGNDDNGNDDNGNDDAGNDDAGNDDNGNDDTGNDDAGNDAGNDDTGNDDAGSDDAGNDAGNGDASNDDTGNDDADNNDGDADAQGKAAFAQTVYPIVRQRCAACHSGFGPGSPSIAHGDLATAYASVVDSQKANLGTPFSSRLVQRLATDGHHCWGDCDNDAEQVRLAISEWAGLVGFDPGAPGTTGIVSASVTLADASEGASGSRFDDDVIALYEFTEGGGQVARDTSGVSPALDLTLSGTEWADGGGIEIVNGKAMGTQAASRKLYDLIASQNGTNEYSVEAWVTPGNSTQEGPARIVSYSRGTGERNFTMGQARNDYVFRNVSLARGLDRNGLPEVVAQDTLIESIQHIVMTFDQTNGRRIFVNGQSVGTNDQNGPGALSNWNRDFTFLLGNETSNDRLWKGIIRFVAVHKRALGDQQIAQHFAAGIGQKYQLTFDTTRWTGAPSSVEFEVSEFDSYSYLFSTPIFNGPNAVRMRDMRIAINGVVPVAGQSFRNVDIVTGNTNRTISPLGSVIAKDRGMEVDQFSLVFAALGDYTSNVSEPNQPEVPKIYSGPERPEMGLRNFDQINNTMAALTGVDVSRTRDTFDGLRQQLPTTFDVQTFVSAHQVAVFKLALEYCDNMVESPQLRDAFFGADVDYDPDFIEAVDFDFDAPADIAFADTVGTEAMFERLMRRMLGNGLESQPAEDEVGMVLADLTDSLTEQCNVSNCDTNRTRTIVKAACSAVLSSAPVLLH